MDVSKAGLDEALERLRQERDELRVKVHLGGMEAKEKWDALEQKWETLQGRVAQAKKDAGEKARDANEAVGVIAKELQAAYKRIRNDLSVE